ncbi:MAG: hypothetical protein RMJ97_06980 [Raineya sp.]|nr:DUF3450 domain-containing protein [Raineya sp.]MDW8296613.1 hypothetical protein [Raineya sp.]
MKEKKFQLNDKGIKSLLEELKFTKNRRSSFQIFEGEIALTGMISFSQLEKELIEYKYISKNNLRLDVFEKGKKMESFNLVKEGNEQSPALQGTPTIDLQGELQKIRMEFEIANLKQENEQLKERNTQLKKIIEDYENNIDKLEEQIKPLQKQASFADKLMLGVQNALPLIAQQPKVVEVLSGLLPQENQTETLLSEEDEVLLNIAKQLQEIAKDKTNLLFEIVLELARKQDKIEQVLLILNENNA